MVREIVIDTASGVRIRRNENLNLGKHEFEELLYNLYYSGEISGRGFGKALDLFAKENMESWRKSIKKP